MGFVEKMKKSMKQLEEACKENTEWNKCIYECPFTEYCTALTDAGLFDPMVGAFLRNSSTDVFSVLTDMESLKQRLFFFFESKNFPGWNFQKNRLGGD